MAQTPPSNKPVLQWTPRPLCVAHEVAPAAEGPAHGDMHVAGYSFCYSCGTTALGMLLETPTLGFGILDVLRMYRDGIMPVAD